MVLVCWFFFISPCSSLLFSTCRLRENLAFSLNALAKESCPGSSLKVDEI